ncbi:ATP-binding protein [Rhizobium sp. 007]|uniref:ATP-binding protein n=1 Tax=Rhizobium sp. 007 TaxID=2785056 RepID=UPI00188E8DEF|nr:ATP-binding protein [Rhizobium sp. 007]QPB18545.1 ATP-binding protein [Rhizobium sp. 007]
MDLVRSKGQIAARFLAMRIDHPRADLVYETFDAMREGRRLTPGRNEMVAGTYFADSGYGKSTIIRMYLERQVVNECYERGLFTRSTPRERVMDRQRLVLHVSLPSNTRMKGLMQKLLSALGDPRPDSGPNVDAQIYSAEKLMRQHKVELLIIDEVDHLRVPPPRSTTKRDEATSVHNHLKSLLIAGYPIMFVGIPEAHGKLFSEDQMLERDLYPISPDALDYANEKDFKLLMDFAADLGIILKEKGIMREWSDFLSGDTLQCFFLAGKGLLGSMVRLLWKAAEIAFEEGAMRVERTHLERATDMFAIRKKYIDYNPFREGPRSTMPLKKH